MNAVSNPTLATRRLVVPINRSLRMTGVFYFAYSVLTLATFVQRSAGKWSEGAILAAIILGAFALFGLALMLSIERFSVADGNYRLEKGLWPFVDIGEGPLSDIRAIVIDRVSTISSDGELTHTAPSSRLNVRVEWNNGRAVVPLFSAAVDEKSVARADEVANAIGCRLERTV